MALLVVESVFLITAGAPLWPSNASFPAPTAAETAWHNRRSGQRSWAWAVAGAAPIRGT